MIVCFIAGMQKDAPFGENEKSANGLASDISIHGKGKPK